ncbi:hypothetical protein Trydic_g18203 [Trypoxylus dichotomus]
MLDRPKPLDFTKFPRRVLWSFGFYFGDGMEKHVLHKTICFISLILITPFPAMILAKILLDVKDDLQALLETLHYLFLHLWIVVKVIIFLCRFPRLRKLEIWLQDDIFNSHTRRQDKFIRKLLSKQTNFFKLLWSSTMSFTSMFALFPPADNVSLNIPIWTPLRLNRTIWHIYEVFCYVITASVYPAIDCVITGLIANMTAQLEILGDNFEKTADRDPTESFEVQESRIQGRLRKYIAHHIAILQSTNPSSRYSEAYTMTNVLRDSVRKGPAFKTIGFLALSMMMKSIFLFEGQQVNQSDIKHDCMIPEL